MNTERHIKTTGIIVALVAGLLVTVVAAVHAPAQPFNGASYIADTSTGPYNPNAPTDTLFTRDRSA